MNNKQKMQDILKDTVDYYAEDPSGRRSVTDDGDCMYTWGKKHCAVGRFLKKKYQDETWDGNNESVNQLCLNADAGEWNIDWCLRDEAQGLDANFWRDLQDIHDTVGNWEEWHEHRDGVRNYGLTDIGKQRYVIMQDKIAGEKYDG